MFQPPEKTENNPLSEDINPNYLSINLASNRHEQYTFLDDKDEKIIITPPYLRLFSFARWLTRNTFFSNLYNYSSEYNRSRLNYYFHGHAFPTDSSQILRNVWLLKNLNKMSIFSELILPATFIIELMRELKYSIYYRDIKMAWQILLGIAPYSFGFINKAYILSSAALALY